MDDKQDESKCYSMVKKKRTNEDMFFPFTHVFFFMSICIFSHYDESKWVYWVHQSLEEEGEEKKERNKG